MDYSSSSEGFTQRRIGLLEAFRDRMILGISSARAGGDEAAVARYIRREVEARRAIRDIKADALVGRLRAGGGR